MRCLIGTDEQESVNTKYIYVGVNNTAKRVTRAYIGVNGMAKLFFGDIYYPTVGEVVVDIAVNQSYTDLRKYVKGQYRVEIQSAATSTSFVKDVVVDQNFQIQAYCPGYYSGVLTGAPATEFSSPSIFGGHGGNDAKVNVTSSTGSSTGTYFVVSKPAGNAIGYGGACCHILPVHGVFGTDYLYAFHCGNTKGGAYGGGAGGRGARTYSSATRVYINNTGGAGTAGIGGAGGTGGTGTIDGQPGTGSKGNPGTAGQGTGAGTPTMGGVAFYDGKNWSEPTRLTKTETGARIKVIYLGPAE